MLEGDGGAATHFMATRKQKDRQKRVGIGYAFQRPDGSEPQDHT